MKAFVTKKIKDVLPPTNQSQIEFHLVEESHSFTTPDEDFFIITSIDGVKILDLIREEKSIGIFSAKPCANSNSFVFENDKLVKKKPSHVFFDTIYFQGGAFFKSSELEPKKKYSSMHDFLNQEIHKLYIRSANGKMPALFLDRDGVINQDCGYPSDVSDIEIINEIVPVIKLANNAGWPVIVLTNQSGIARGKLDEEKLKDIHDFIRKELAVQGADLLHFYFCPYHENGIVDKYKKASLSRKPYPLMALKAAEDLQINLSKSVMVGDKISDQLYGLGMQTFLLESKYIKNQKNKPENLVSDHRDLLTRLLRLMK